MEASPGAWRPQLFPVLFLPRILGLSGAERQEEGKGSRRAYSSGEGRQSFPGSGRGLLGLPCLAGDLLIGERFRLTLGRPSGFLGRGPGINGGGESLGSTLCFTSSSGFPGLVGERWPDLLL